MICKEMLKRMQCNKLAANPNLHKNGVPDKTNVLAA